jgi:UDP-3-O-[3-hydroxymyristoyl] N-acetylglucosamine deacetylase
MFSYQKTIKNSVCCFGVGLHTGANVNIIMHPADEGVGIVFKRSDVADSPYVDAFYSNVCNTMLGTTIANEKGVTVATIEHLMAALWGCGIDNCMIEVDGPEMPIMDGSSEPFVFLIECAGIKEQKQMRRVIEVIKPIRVEDPKKNGGYLEIKPADAFMVDLKIDFGENVISDQKAQFDARQLSFKNALSRARTFCFSHEVETMKENGLARGGSLENAIVVSHEGILNEGSLRYSDEFVRHKILDCVGDIYLAGAYVKGRVEGFKSGHGLNNQLLRAMFKDKDAWRLVQLPEGSLATAFDHVAE